MKRLVLITISILVFLSSIAIAEEDYKHLYLEQKVQSLQMELQALQLRFVQVQNEIPQVLAELREYTKAKTRSVGDVKKTFAQDEKKAQPKEK